MPFNYKTYSDLSKDIARGIQAIPEVDLVVGVPKSGLVPATIIATLKNVEILDLESFAFIAGTRSGSRRLSGSQLNRPRVLIVDDTINTGAQLRAVKQRLAALNSTFDITYLAVYGTSESDDHSEADIVLGYVAQPRFFQWNYRNHIIAEHALFDMDGVLCRDPTDDQNDDGDEYRLFMRKAEVLALPRKKLSAIVTSRLEKYRAETVEWLAANNVKYGELIMLDLPSAEERRRRKAHAPFKAEVYRARDEVLFIESNWRQAQEIARLSDKPVICTENDVLIYGAGHLQDLKEYGLMFDGESSATINELRRQNNALREALEKCSQPPSKRKLRDKRVSSFVGIRNFAKHIFSGKR